LRAERPAQAKKASAIVRLANETARQTRLTARSLEGADGVGDLKVALEALAAKIRKNCRVAANVKADASSFVVSAPAAAQLYRIVQEALHNAVEHGRARNVQIDLAVDSDNMVLTVRDDGKGFDGTAALNGMGLRIMRYRAQCIGGSCEVQSNGAQGTIVTCRVPLQADAAVRPIP
jgi:signal transduction histidine kinase